MTRPLPLVSAVVPNYNNERSLAACVRSLQAQTYPTIEIIVADDSSTDRSVRVAEELGVRVVRTGVNSGVAVARNLGAAAARGEILLFVDSDVALDESAAERAVARLQADPGLGAVCGIYHPEPLVRDSVIEECRCLQAHYWRFSSVGTVSFLFTSICAMRAEVFAAVGSFNPRLRQTEEVDYGQRLSRRADVLLSPDILGRHDDDSRLLPLLRKVFRRGRLRVPLYARRRRFARGFETPARAVASVAALAAVLSLALPGVLGWPAAVVPPALLAGSIGADRGMYGYVLRRRGLPFTLVFAGVCLAVNVAIAAGIVAGLAQWAVWRPFRRLYDLPDALQAAS